MLAHGSAKVYTPHLQTPNFEPQQRSKTDSALIDCECRVLKRRITEFKPMVEDCSSLHRPRFAPIFSAVSYTKIWRPPLNGQNTRQ